MKLRKTISKWMNKEMPVKYMALYFLILTILVETIIIGMLTYSKVYTYGLGEEENYMTARSNVCYEKKNVGKVCLVEKKVYWYERIDVEGVIKK